MKENVYYYRKEDKQYPKRMQPYKGMPQKIYLKGALPGEQIPSVAIVGARMCSPYGRQQAYTYAKLLARHGVQVISGMALGVDSYAHEGALDGGGMTFAVLGCGVDICYPAQNRSLYARIQKQGGILSEFPLGTAPLARHFPMRNRIISALSDLVLVVEAKEKSGSLITADFALEQGKTVLALPGRVDDELSKGCNRLIAQGAGVAYSVESVLNELDMVYVSNRGICKKSKIRLATVKDLVYSCVDLTPKDLHVIMEEVPDSAPEISKALLELQLEGKVWEPFKNYYVRSEVED